MSSRAKLALVGAANVGKSTFCNRILGGRRSIVDDSPGVTRDRLYLDLDLAYPLGEYETDRCPVTLIDTAGLFGELDDLTGGMRQQTEAAMEEADAILFMVDGRAGITGTDVELAREFRGRAAQKPIILLVNKLDGLELVHSQLAEFYSLGLGEPLPFSSTGSTFKACLRDLVARIRDLGLVDDNAPAEDEDSASEGIKVAILGRPNVGKSSLLNRLVGEDRALVHAEAGTTRDALDTEMTHGERRFLLVDTAGLRRKSRVEKGLERYAVDRAIKALVRCEIAVLVLDATQGVSRQEQRLAELIRSRGRGCVLVLNKWDLIDKDDYSYRRYVDSVKRQLQFVDYAPVLVVSAASGQRVDTILDSCLEVHSSMRRRISTGLLNKVMAEILAIHRVRQDFKIYYVTQVGVSPPTFTLFVNTPDACPKNFPNFLDKKLREEFEFGGAPMVFQLKKSQ